MYKYRNLFNHPPIDGQSASFSFGATTSKSSKTILIHIAHCICAEYSQSLLKLDFKQSSSNTDSSSPLCLELFCRGSKAGLQGPSAHTSRQVACKPGIFQSRTETSSRNLATPHFSFNTNRLLRPVCYLLADASSLYGR